MKNRKTDAKRAGDETAEGPGAAHEAPRPEQELTRDSEGSTEMLRNCLEVMRLSELAELNPDTANVDSPPLRSSPPSHRLYL